MLNRRGRSLDDGGAPGTNLVIVVVFAVLAMLLLGKTWTDSRGIRSDIHTGITPQMSAVDGDLGALSVLDRTGSAAERIATQILPIAVALGRAADATTAAARDTEAVRDDIAATKESIDGIDTSTTATLATLTDLVPLVVEIASGTGDIRDNLALTARQTAQAATALARLLTRLGGIEKDAGAVAARAREIEAVLKRIEGRSENAAAARILQCPREPQACAR